MNGKSKGISGIGVGGVRDLGMAACRMQIGTHEIRAVPLRFKRGIAL